MASTLSLVWVGDLDQEKHKSIKYTSFPPEKFQPRRIEMKPSRQEIKIGRVNSKLPPDFVIESCINNRMISRNHATIERSSKGSGFMLYDHSLNGTYINYRRVSGGVNLAKGDIVCFGHINGANLKPGEEVSPFYSDLKYKVDIISGKRKRTDSPNSAASSKQSDSEDNASVSSSNQSARKKSLASTKKRSRAGGDGAGDAEPRKSQKPRKSIAPRQSNKPGKTSNKRRREDADGKTVDLFHYETEKCSAPVCKQPQDAAVDWIQCDDCTLWYHQLCIGCKPQEAESDTYYCPACK